MKCCTCETPLEQQWFEHHINHTSEVYCQDCLLTLLRGKHISKPRICIKTKKPSFKIQANIHLPVVKPKKHVLKFDYPYVTFDGASKGDRRAGAGAVKWVDNVVVERRNLHLPKATNNEAEYQGIILALQMASEMIAKTPSIEKIGIVGDSKLVINQVLGKFAVRSTNLIPLHGKAHQLYQDLLTKTEVIITHVLRKFNNEADQEANMGVKNAPST